MARRSFLDDLTPGGGSNPFAFLQTADAAGGGGFPSPAPPPVQPPPGIQPNVMLPPAGPPGGGLLGGAPGGAPNAMAAGVPAAATEGDDEADEATPDDEEAEGASQIAPSAAAQPPQGLLQRIMAPSPDGLTFADKLFASGALLKGDEKSAASYLTARRSALAKAATDAQKTKDAAAKTTQAEQVTKTLAAHFKDGRLDFPGAVQDLASQGIALSAADLKRLGDLRTKLEPINFGQRGGADSFDPFGGTVSTLVGPQPAPDPYGWANGSPTPQFLAGQTAVGKAQRLGKPLQPRAPSGGIAPMPAHIRITTKQPAGG